MIARINLIEREPFKFTYTKIIKSGVVIIILCAVFFGVQSFRVSKYRKDAAKAKAEIVRLKEERVRLLKSAPIKLEGGSQSFLNEVFTQTPRWASLLNDIAGRLPGTVWFSSITAITNFSPSDNEKKGKKKDDKASSSVSKGPKKLVITGQTRSLDDLTAFMSNLTSSPFIQQAILTNSKKESTGFTFTLECDMLAGNQ